MSAHALMLPIPRLSAVAYVEDLKQISEIMSQPASKNEPIRKLNQCEYCDNILIPIDVCVTCGYQRTCYNISNCTGGKCNQMNYICMSSPCKHLGLTCVYCLRRMKKQHLQF